MVRNYPTTGGRPIGSGTYGCVFNPPLKCSNRINSDVIDNKVSKLMFTHHAKDEYDEITKFKKIIEKIHNYRKYFLVDDIKYCSPDKLKDADLIGFDKTCRNLNKNGFTTKNINANLHKFKMLIIKDGGKDLDQFIENSKITNNNLYILIRGIKDIIKNAIIPMNNLDLYNFDVKSSNILIDKDFQMRIIDWGLSGVVKNKTQVSKLINKRQLQYNLPYTIIFMNESFFNIYNKFLNNLKEKSSFPLDGWYLLSFIENYIKKYNNFHGDGHLGYIKRIIYNINKIYPLAHKYKNHSLETSFIIEYLINSLLGFTDEKKYTFDHTRFLEIFYHNTDIWGALISFEKIFQYINSQTHLDFNNKSENLRKIVQLLLTYCFHNYYKKISIPNLMNDLNHILSNIKPFTDIKIIQNSQKPATRKIKKLIINNTNNMKNIITQKIKRKRCPNGTRRNKKTGLCEEKKKLN